MIELDLIQDVPIMSYISLVPNSVSRVGDIVLLPNEVKSGEVYEGRKPWKTFFAISNFRFYNGVFAKKNFNLQYHRIDINIIEVDIIDRELNKIKMASSAKESLIISLIQKNKNNGFQAAVCNANLIGTMKDILAFELFSCEMIYSR